MRARLSKSFWVTEKEEAWRAERSNKFCVLVWLGETETHEPPRYWIAFKRKVGELCAGPLREQNKSTLNTERRLLVKNVPTNWENRWSLFDAYRPVDASL